MGSPPGWTDQRQHVKGRSSLPSIKAKPAPMASMPAISTDEIDSPRNRIPSTIALGGMRKVGKCGANNGKPDHRGQRQTAPKPTLRATMVSGAKPRKATALKKKAPPHMRLKAMSMDHSTGPMVLRMADMEAR
jgi:hypothetical protein